MWLSRASPGGLKRRGVAQESRRGSSDTDDGLSGQLVTVTDDDHKPNCKSFIQVPLKHYFLCDMSFIDLLFAVKKIKSKSTSNMWWINSAKEFVALK